MPSRSETAAATGSICPENGSKDDDILMENILI